MHFVKQMVKGISVGSMVQPGVRGETLMIMHLVIKVPMVIGEFVQ